MIRGKRLQCGGSGEHKPLSLSQEMALSDLLRAALQNCFPGESDPVVTVLSATPRRGCTVCHRQLI